MITKLPFDVDDSLSITEWLTEAGCRLDFGLLQKGYYGFVRPLLPLALRQSIQRRRWSKTVYNKGYIDSEMVDFVLSDPSVVSRITQLYPEHYDWVFALSHDVESLEGMKRIPEVMDVEERHGFRSSWNIVPYLYPVDEGLLREVRERGHEIGIHGYNHDGKLYRCRKTFMERVPEINKALEKYCAVGFRSPMVHRNLSWLQELNIQYDSSCFDYDVFQPLPGGVKSIWPFFAGEFVELPYTMPQDHTLFIVLGEKTSRIWQEKSDWIIKHYGMVFALTHPDYLISESRLNVYEDYLEYISQQKRGWHALPKEIASQMIDCAGNE